MEENVYAAPKAPLDAGQNTTELASRWARLAAAIIDGLILGAIVVPIQFAFGVFEYAMKGQQPPLGLTIGLGLLGILLFFVINGHFLLRDGQTLGKKVLSIKIIGSNDGPPDIATLAKRYGVYMLPPQIPLIGGLFSLVNVLFIFGEKRRCIHDMAADTRVVVA